MKTMNKLKLIFLSFVIFFTIGILFYQKPVMEADAAGGKITSIEYVSMQSSISSDCKTYLPYTSFSSMTDLSLTIKSNQIIFSSISTKNLFDKSESYGDSSIARSGIPAETDPYMISYNNTGFSDGTYYRYEVSYAGKTDSKDVTSNSSHTYTMSYGGFTFATSATIYIYIIIEYDDSEYDGEYSSYNYYWVKYKVNYTYDSTSPTVNVNNNAYVQTLSGIKISDSNGISSAYLSYVPYSNYISVDATTGIPKSSDVSSKSVEGQWKIYAIDKYGNEKNVYVYLDLNAPSITGVTNNGYYRSSVTIQITDTYLNSVVVKNGTTDVSSNYVPSSTNIDNGYKFSISTNGNYTITATDKSGRSSTINFIMDTEAPLISGIENNKYYNSSQTITITDKEGNYKNATLNGTTYTSSSINVSTEGSYTLVAYDKSGNSNSINFVIDTTAPKLDSSDPNSVTNNGFYKIGKVCKVTDANLSSVILYRDETKVTDWQNGYTVSASGVYKVVATDLANNSSTFTFTIDVDAPTLSGISNNSYINKNTTFTLIDSVSTIDWTNSYYTTPGGQKLTWSSNQGTILANEEGKWTIYAKDSCGNAATYYVYVDLNKPTITGIVNKAHYNTPVTPKVSDTYLNTITVTKNGSTISWTNNTAISAVGSYKITATDKIGNTTTYYFVIDTTSPTLIYSSAFTGKIAVNSDVSSDKYISWTTTVPNLTFSWTSNKCSQCSAEEVYNVTINGEKYSNGTNLNTLQDGFYTVIASDKAGNSTKYTFIINNNAPSGTFSKNPLVTDTNIYSLGTSFNWTESGCSATLNGKTYTSGTAINTNGKYTLILTDVCGLSKTYEFYIDSTIASIELKDANSNVITNNGYTNAPNVTITSLITGVSGYKATYTYDGSAKGNFTQSTPFKDDGTYVLTINGNNGNTTTFTFTIDTKPAELTVQDLNGSTINNAGATNQSVKFSWTENNCKLSVNGNVVTTSGKSYTIAKTTGDGTYTVILYDHLDNQTTFSYILDTTAPTGILSTSQSGGFQNSKYTNGNVTFSWEDEATATYTKDGVSKGSYSKGNELVENGTYTFVLTDSCGNVSTTYTAIIDKTSPTGTLTGVTNGGITKTNVTFTWDEANITVTYTLNSGSTTTYSKGSSLSKEGNYIITLVDLANNSTTYSFEIDKTSPTGTLTGVTNGGATNTNVSLTWTDTRATATYTKDGVSKGSYTKNKSLSEEGNYVITLKDIASNSTTYSFTIDKKGPTLTADNVVNNGSTNKDVTFTWDENNCVLKINGETKSLSSKTYKIAKTSGDGTYTVVLADYLGNETTFTYTLDYSAPTGTLTGVENGGATNTNVKFAWTESGCSATYTKDGISKGSYTSGNQLTEEGTYIITLTDSNSNSTTYSFVIDKTAPSLTAKDSSSTVLTSGIYTNKAVTFTWSENNCVLKVNGETKSLSSKEYTIAKNTGDKSYTVVLADYLGNETTFTYTLDTTPATLTTNNVSNGGFTNTNVTFTWKENNCKLFVNGNNVTPASAKTYTIAKTSGDGTYTVVLYDHLDNQTTFSYTLDTTPATLSVDNVSNGGYTNTNVTFTWTENNCKLSVNENVVTTSGKSYTIAKTTGDGTYTVVLYDHLDNPTTFTYTLDTTAPAFVVYSNSEELEKQTAFNNIAGISLVFNESNVTATLNGEVYVSGTNLTEETSYTFIISDALGNTSTYNFSLDYTPYTKNYEYFFNNYYGNINHWWTTYDYILQTGESKNNYVKNQTFSFANYEMAKDYALKREYATVETGTYVSGGTIWSNTYNCYVDIYSNDLTLAITGATYYIYKSPESATNYVAYFSEATSLQTVYTQYAIDSIKEFNHTTGTITTAAPGELITLTYNNLPLIYVKGSIVFNNKPTENKLYVNSVSSSYLNTITEDGLYHILEIDEAGNEFEYYLSLDNTVASFKVSEISNPSTWQNQLNNTTSIYVTESLKVSAYDESDANAILIIEHEDGSKEYVYNGIGYEFNKTGIYKVSIVDTCKNTTTTKQITLSYETPSIVFTDNLDSEQSILGFTVTFVPGNNYNKLSSISIQKYNEETGAWENQTSDSNGTFITNSTTSYYFTSSGQYLIHWIDNFGRNSGTGVPYLLERDKPRGYLISNSQTLDPGTVTYNPDGSINQLYPSITNKSVYLTWEDEAGNRLTGTLIYKNGTVVSETYYKDNFIKDPGTYIIRLTNNDEGYKDFVFTIDTTAPIGTIYTETTNELVTTSKINKNIYFTWLEENCKCYYTTSNSSNKLVYYQGTVLSEELTYTFYLYDSANNEAVYEITLDFTPPNVVIYSGSKIIANNSFTNGNIKFVFNEKNVTATLNGDEYLSGTVMSKNIQYILTISDSCGNTTTYKVTRDATPLSIKLYNESNQEITFNSYMNQPFKIYASKDECEYLVNGFEFEEGTLISKDDIYEIYITDKYGNKYENTITLDTISPTGVLTTTQEGGFRDGNVTNGNVSFKANESKVTILLNGEKYTSGTIIKTEGSHLITITDLAGNVTEYTFTIDKTGGKVTLYGVSDGGYTNGNVYASWEESDLIVLLNENEYVDGELIEAESAYSLKVIDKANNIVTYTFEIDRTAAIGELTTTQKGGFREGNLTSGNVSFTWSESKVTVLLDNNLYAKGTVIKTEGSHLITITDLAGNVTEYAFIINKEYPQGTLTGVENNGYTNTNVTFTWDDTLGYTATLNGDSYANGNLIAEENSYELILTAPNGLTTTYNWTIDLTAPTGELTTTQKGGFREGNLTSGNVSFTWLERNVTVLHNGEIYTNGASIKTEGSHLITITDLAGNVTEYAFIINKEYPQGTLTGVENNGYTNTNVTFTWDDTLGYTATLNGDSYANGNLIAEENSYELILTAPNGLTTTYNWTIDLTAPVGELTTTQKDGFKENNLTSGNVSFTWLEKNMIVLHNDEIYTIGSSIKTEGSHLITITDLAGNVTEYAFIINKEYPQGTLTGVENNGYTNTNVTFTWDDTLGYTATLNGDSYANGNLIAEENSYELILTAPNGLTTTYNWTIDLTAPVGELTTTQKTGFKNGNITNGNVSLVWDGKATATLNGNPYTEGSLIRTEGNHLIVLQDEVGNVTEYTFTIDKTSTLYTLTGVENGGVTKDKVTFEINESYSKVLITYVNSGLTIESSDFYFEFDEEEIIVLSLEDEVENQCSISFEIDRTAPTGILTNVENGGYTNKSVTFTWDGSDNYALLNNEPYTKGASIKTEQLHQIELFDKVGNSSIYTFTIDKTPVTYTAWAEFNSNNKTKDSVIFTWEDGQASAFINSAPYIMGSTISEEGEYVFSISDLANNTSSFTFTVDKTPVTYILVGVENGGITPNKVTCSWNEKGTATLNGEPYTNGKTISADGVYELIIYDDCLNSTIITFEIDTDIPTAILDGVENEGHTNTNVLAYWEDETITATLNGAIYNAHSIIYNEGYYELILQAQNGLTNKYTFTIDKTPGNVKLTGVEVEDITSSDVQITWEEDLTVFVNDVEIENGHIETLSGKYSVLIVDLANNKKTINFEIDKIAPSYTIIGLNSYSSLTNETVQIIFFESNATATLNDTIYTSGQLIETDGEYTFYICDTLGNYSQISFEIDKTAAVGELTTTQEGGFRDGNVTNGEVTFICYEENVSILINNQKYTSGTVIKKPARYIITVSDLAGNISSYEFTIDDTKPSLRFNDNEDNVISLITNFTTNKDVIISPITEKTQIYVNSELYEYFAISEEGIYIVKAIYLPTGQTTEYTFTIDKTAPVGELTTTQEGGFRDGNITNGKVSFTWTEKAKATLNGEYYSSGSLISKAGTYEIIISDDYGNIRFYEFEIDSTIPTVKFVDYLGLEISTITNFTTNKDVSIIALTTSTEIYVNNELYEGTAISEEGTYTIKVVYLPTGQTTEYTFTIDKTAPVGELTTTQEGGFRDGNITNGKVSFTWTEKAKATLNGEYYSSGSLISKANKYVITISDDYGNVNTYSFEIDLTIPTLQFMNSVGEILSTAYEYETAKNIKIQTTTPSTEIYVDEVLYDGSIIEADGIYEIKLIYLPTGQTADYKLIIDSSLPEGVLTGVENGGITANNVTFTWDTPNCSATLNGLPYTKGSTIKAEGDYTIVLTNKLGVSTVYSFTINKQSPIATLYGVENNGYTNQEVWCSWDSSTITATLNGEPYENETPIQTENVYELILLDINGLTTTYNWTIDLTAPTGVLTTTQEGGFRDGNITNGKVTLTCDEAKVSILINDEVYPSGTTIKTEGKYFVKITDLANNTTEYEFEIDSTIPKLKFVSETNELLSEAYEYETAKKVVLEAITYSTEIYVNEVLYDEEVIEADGIYEIKLIYLPTGQTANYKLIVDTTAPTGVLTGVEDGGVTANNVTFTWDTPNCSATINGVNYTKGSAIRQNNFYEIILTNKLGVSTTYSFTINKEYPKGTLNGVENNGYINQEVWCSWDSSTITATLNGEPYTNGESVTAEGIYELILSDINGLTTTYNWTIDLTAPTGVLTTTQEGGFRDGNITNGNVTFTSEESKMIITLNDENYTSGSIIKKPGKYVITITDLANNTTEYEFEIDSTIPKLKFVSETNELLSEAYEYETAKKVVLEAITYSTKIYVNESLYDGSIIETDGSYEIKLIYTPTKQIIFYKLIIDTTAPTGILTGVEDGGVTANNVTFTWEIPNCSATVNGSPYTKGSSIKIDGEYEVILTNKLGVSTTYSFTINKEYPKGTLNGVKNNGYTNQEVWCSWDSSTITATLNGEPYTNGESVTAEGIYELILSDINGLTTTYNWTIDLTAPTGVLTTTQEGGFRDGNITNGNVVFTCGENKVSISLNDEFYTSGTVVKKENSYVILVKDLAGNITEYKFKIDLTIPTLQFLNETDEKLSDSFEYETAKKIHIQSTTSSTEIYVNESLYDGSIIETDGTYEIKLVYLPTGQTANYKLIVDTTAPTGILTGVENGGITANNVKFEWESYLFTATIKFNDNDAVSYSKGTTLREDGNYTIVLTNKLGVSTIYSFTINKSIPLVTVRNEKDEIIELKLDQYINYNVDFDFHSSFIATLNNEVYVPGTLVSEEGNYTLTVTNPENKLQTVLVFTIDKTAPALKVDGVDLEVGYTNQTVELSWTRNEAALYVNGEKVATSGNYKISSNGNYNVSLIDLAGNSTSISFERNKTNLTTDLIISEYKKLNEETGESEVIQDSIKSTYTEAVKFVIGNELKTYLIYTNAEGEEVVVEYNGEELTENNDYKLKIEDKYGNTSTFKFKVNIDYSVENPNFLGNNIAIIVIIIVPTFIILCFVFFKFKSKNSNPFAAKKRRKA